MYIFKQLIINSIKGKNWIAATTKTKEDIAAWQQHNRCKPFYGMVLAMLKSD